MKKKLKKLSAISIASGFYIMSLVKVFAAGTIGDGSTEGTGDVETQITSWGDTLIKILVQLVRIGGIISLVGIGIFLFFNNDEAGAKRGKIAFVIVLLATFIAWFAPMIINTFIK